MGRKPSNKDQKAGVENAPVNVSDVLKENISEKDAEKSSPKKNHVSNHKKFDKFK